MRMRGFLSHTIFVPVAVVLLIGILAKAPAFAQSDPSQLSGAATSWLGTPPPADCIAPAASVDAIIDPLTTPGAYAESAFPLSIPTEADLPTGQLADEQVVQAAAATMWAAVACLNAGDFGRFFSLLSPQGIRAFYFGIAVMMGGEPKPPTAQDIAETRENLTNSLAKPPTVVPADEQVRIDGIRDARMLPDGRLVFVVDGAIGDVSSMYLVFSLANGVWMIDAFGQIGILDNELGG